MQYTFDGNNNILGHNTKKSDNVDEKLQKDNFITICN